MMLRTNEVKETKISLEIMLDDYIHDIYEIEKECFSEPWSEKTIKDTINNDNSYFIVAKFNSSIVGYAGMYFICGEGYIYNIAVTSNYRNLGIGKKLLRALEDYSCKINLSFLSLEVRKTNYKAIQLYKKSGFLEVGVRKDFYKFPKEDAIIMTKYF